jgi:hypothetical protein
MALHLPHLPLAVLLSPLFAYTAYRLAGTSTAPPPRPLVDPLLMFHYPYTLERPCAREYVEKLLPIKNASQYDAVTFCGFKHGDVHTGNAIQLVIGALIFCKLTGIKHIDAKGLIPFEHTLVTTDGITIWGNDTMPSTLRVFSQSCFFVWGLPICRDYNLTDIAATFREQFLATFPRAVVPDNTVVMNIRGADAWNENPPSNYWQPPCPFFTDVQDQFARTLVVASDKRSPCVQILIDRGAEFSGLDWKSDFATMLYAKNFVLSRSSFSRGALYLSAVKKNFYVFEGEPDSINGRWAMFTYRFLEHGDHWNCEASEAYKQWILPRGMGNWTADFWQRNLIRKERCHWKRVALKERSFVPQPVMDHDVGCGWFVHL